MGMTLKELLTKGEGTLSAQEAKDLAAQCRMDVETLYTLLEERGIKILDNEVEADTSLDVDSIIAEVENAENNSDDMGISEEEEESAEENPADTVLLQPSAPLATFEKDIKKLEWGYEMGYNMACARIGEIKALFV